jgi:hypothetical protein
LRDLGARPDPTPTELAKRLVPHVDDHTVALIMADLERIDAVDVLQRLGLTDLRAFPASNIRGLLRRYDAAGGGPLLVGFSTREIRWDMIYLLTPLDRGSDVEDLETLLRFRRTFESRQRGGVLMSAAPGIVDHLGKHTVNRSHLLTTAMSAGPDAAFRLCLVPTADLRHGIRDVMPALPKSWGSIATDPLTTDIAWLTLTVNTKPALTAELRIQCTSDEGPRRVYFAVSAILSHLKNSENVGEHLPRIAQALQPITFRKEGRALVLPLDERTLDGIVQDLVAPLVGAVVEEERHEMSLNNVRKIILAGVRYAQNSDDGAWADDLQALVASGLLRRWALANPRLPEREMGYVYLKPSVPWHKMKDAGRTPIVHEAYDAWPKRGIWVGFTDGHAERYVTEATFRKEALER